MSRAYKIHNPEGVYFVTITSIAWIDVFTRFDYRELILDSLRHCQKEKGLLIFAWCLMTNHLHLMIKVRHGNDLTGVLRDFKKFTSRELIKAIKGHPKESRKDWMLSKFRNAGQHNSNNQEYQFWQQHNKPIELWSSDAVQQKLDYIHMNPVEAGFVEKPEDYLFSSARDFNEIKGLLNLEPL